MKTLSVVEKKTYDWIKQNPGKTMEEISDATGFESKNTIERLRLKGVRFETTREGARGKKQYTIFELDHEDVPRYKKYPTSERGARLFQSLVGLNEVVTDIALPDAPSYTFKDNIAVMGLADIHTAHPHNDLRELQRICHDVVPETDNLYVQLLGDLLDNSNTTNSPKGARSNLSAEEEMELLEWLLDPMFTKGKVLGICDGNHEARTQRSSGLRLGKLVAKRYKDIPYSTFGMHVHMTVDKHPTKFYFRHAMDGYSQYNPLHPNSKAALFREAGDADVIWRAHTHESAIGEYKVEGIYRILMVSGNTVAYDSYADRLAMSPRMSSYPLLIITKDGRRLPFRRLTNGLHVFNHL